VERPDRGEATLVAALLLVLLHPAKFDARLTHRVAARQTVGHEIVGAMLDVQPELVSHLTLEPGARDRRVHGAAKPAKHD
jgi:hypothetical protein